jgi:hypothetical protein
LTNTTEHKPKPVAAEAPHAKTKSKGEKFFDRVVYGGLAGVGTFFATLLIAEKFKNGDWAGPRYQRTVNSMSKFLNRFCSEKMSKEIAEQSVQTTSLMMGGNAMLIPIGIAEHYKKPIVSGLNVMMGDETPPEKIDQTPKQTWRSLIEGRLLAWVTVFATLVSASSLFKRTFQTYCDEFGEKIYKLTRWAKSDGLALDMKETKSYRMGNIAALDIFATAAAATLLYVGGHFFARKQEQKKEVRAARRQSAMGEPRRDDATIVATPAEESLDKSEPVAKIGGDKQHQGLMAAAPELQASIGA